MDTKQQILSEASNRVYEDYEPDSHWERNETTATLIVQLPGFRREQLRVQVTSTPLLKIIGEQPLSDNNWRRINKEFQIPPGCNPDGITAKFERGRLIVVLPVVIPEKALEPDQAGPPKPSNEVSHEEKPQKENELPKKEEEEDTREGKKKMKKVRTSGVVEYEGKKLGFDHQNEGLMKRTKTRVLDYTISLKPTFEEYKNSVGELKKPNKLMNSILVILFVVALGIYVKNAFRSFLGGSSN